MAEFAAPAERGALHVHPRVIERIAEAAALEVDHSLRYRSTVAGIGTGGLPKCDADVAGLRAVLDVEIAARWAAPLADVSSRVREHITDRLREYAAVTADRTNVRVTKIVTSPEPRPRVQ